MTKSFPAAIAALVLFSLVLPSSVPAQALKPSQLPPAYRAWLEEVVGYIIAPRERDVFLALRTDRERDIFIGAFWKHRDPTPGTPRNEFREEHERRVKRANEVYGRGTPLPGWRTDRGRIYILLGEPRTVEQYDAVNGVYPVEIWSYLGDGTPGLPTAFNIIFFKRQGSGDYVLYSPTQDGPEALIAESMRSYRDDRQVYEALRKLEPNLARQVLTLIPGERTVPGTESLASMRLMASIAEAPRRRVNVEYADAFLRFKDQVDVEYSANYIASDAAVAVLRDPSGEAFVNYTIEPSRISVEDAGGGTYEARFALNGRVSDAAGRTIYQFDKEMPLKLTAADLEALKATSVSLQDAFPLVAGTYHLDLLLKNTASREFTGAALDVTVPGPAAGPRLGPILLAYRAERRPVEPGGRVPFRAGDDQLLCQGRKSFGAQDAVVTSCEVDGLDDAARAAAALEVTFLREDVEVFSKTVAVPPGPVGRLVDVQPLRNFAPGYYRVAVSLRGAGGRELAAQHADFEVSLSPTVPRPRVVARVAAADRPEDEMLATGVQMVNAGDVPGGLARLKAAYDRNPARADLALPYAQALFRSADYAGVTRVLAPFADAPDGAAEAVALAGQASHALGDFRRAAELYAAYLKRFGANVDILNFLGTCQLKMDDREGALQAWTKSLELKPDQPRIKQLVEDLKK